MIPSVDPAAAHAKPRAGDRMVTDGVEYFRAEKRLLDRNGKEIGFDCWGGFKNFVWKEAKETADELQAR